jgi:hypothetical protein
MPTPCSQSHPSLDLRRLTYVRNCWTLFCKLVLISTFWFVAPANAAEITIGSTVVLEGPIEPGDYDKL